MAGSKRFTDKTASNAKASDKPYRLYDRDGLYLRVAPSGIKSWEYRYVQPGTGKGQTAVLGRYPALGLAEARDAAQDARKLIAKGIHPTAQKRVVQASAAAAKYSTFKALAADWVAAERLRKGWSDGYVREVENSIENHLDDLIALRVEDIRAAMCAPIIRRLEKRTPDMAAKVAQRLNAILDFGVEHGQIDRNPLPAVRRPHRERSSYAAVVTREGVGEILRAADAANPGKGVRRAHALLVFTAQRVGEIVPAEWSEVDLEAGTWSVPRERMKRKDTSRGAQIVPLPTSLHVAMREWHRADGRDAVYVCPSPRGDRSITREAMEKFYRVQLGLAGKHSPHSWRSVLSTWGNDAGRDRDAIESQLDHVTGSEVQTAYDRAQRLERRRELMAWHERALLAARDGADVVPLRKGA